MTDPQITLIGAGNIAHAIATGLLDSGYDATKITACDPNLQQLKKFRNLGVESSQSNIAGISKAEVILLCVKPDLMQRVCEGLSNELRKEQLVLSVAAGISTHSMEIWLNSEIPIIRCMPNTPALVRKAMTVLFGNALVDQAHKAVAERILGSVGAYLWIEDEADMDAVTAVSGSGPAYFFLTMEALHKAAINLGLDEEFSLQLVRETALGAAELVCSGSASPENLRQEVTSPGGTTEAAIEKLLENNFIKTFDQAVQAAYSRSVELSKS